MDLEELIETVLEEVEANIKPGVNIDDMFFLEDLKQRKLFINVGVDQSSVAGIVRHIMDFNRCDKGKPVEERQPIIIYITCRGGFVDDGFELIDAILCSKTPVYTVVNGYAYSMGFLIAIAGHKRFAQPSARYLLHDGDGFSSASTAKMHDTMRFNERAEKRVADYILSRSNITQEEYDKNYRVEWWMFADEAKEKGFVDSIIGVDCDIDEVI